MYMSSGKKGWRPEMEQFSIFSYLSTPNPEVPRFTNYILRDTPCTCIVPLAGLIPMAFRFHNPVSSGWSRTKFRFTLHNLSQAKLNYLRVLNSDAAHSPGLLELDPCIIIARLAWQLLVPRARYVEAVSLKETESKEFSSIWRRPWHLGNTQ